MRAKEFLPEDWQKVNKHDKTDGLSQKAVNAYRRENPGSKLKTAVTTKPSKLKKGSKAAKRRKSFCARMSGNKGPMKKPNGKPTPKALALRRWNCESIEEMRQLIEHAEQVIIQEKWTKKYKSSINCSHPKGFSQKAHCAGKKKHNEDITTEAVCPDCGMCQTHGNLNEIKKGAKDSNGYSSCWSGYHAAGTKKGKNGGRVRNCVPNESIEEAEKQCPPATQDITLNLKNRQKAINEYGYGPLNPDMPNRKFWMAKVDEWNLDSVKEAQQSLCGNCAAFDQRADTLDCIAQGIGSEQGADDPTIEAGDLGYCRFLKFKCASRRTCDAWVTGGPLTDGIEENITPNDIHRLADQKNIKWDDEPSFLQLTKRLTGKEHLDDLDQDELRKVKNHLDSLDENFADGRHPEDKGDAKRHGINTKASVSSLRKTAKQGGRKGQLAHWLANMKAGRAKKK
jgi:Domain of unknown function (DUF6321)